MTAPRSKTEINGTKPVIMNVIEGSFNPIRYVLTNIAIDIGNLPKKADHAVLRRIRAVGNVVLECEVVPPPQQVVPAKTAPLSDVSPEWFHPCA